MLDGKALLKVPAKGSPLMIHTRLMRLEVKGSSTLEITARSRESGEEIEVLQGEVIVNKNYSSPYRVPDDLHGGEMSMVNESIDLMEKEHMDGPSVEALSRRVGELNRRVEMSRGRPHKGPARLPQGDRSGGH